MIARTESITIPTYLIGPDEPNPMFYEKRCVQGASGRVFPMAMNSTLTNRKCDQTYEAIKLENEYISLTLLPQLGGKVYRARARYNGYDFIYYNRVIKPALIGNCGPWTSGGIEFNWPQHHRPTTYLPVEYELKHNPDGSATAWMGETEPMGRTRGRVGITVYPGRSYMRAQIRLYNRSDVTQSFMWWANLAVAVNRDYRAIFPPDIHWASDHAWASTSGFPIVSGDYKGADFGAGRDVRDYNNLPMSASFFTYNSKYDFLGGYDFGAHSGTIHIADRHVAPGKKMFTWGVSPFAQAWYDKLTDDDGPYIELMTGVFSRNQPDFSWIAPHEYRTADQYWYPIQGIGYVKNATLDAALALDFEGDVIKLGLNVTGVFRNVRVRMSCRGQEAFSETLMYIKPGDVYLKRLPRPAGSAESDIRVDILADDGRTLVSYQPDPPTECEIPAPFEPTPEPQQLKTNEELYFHALHLFQYRHPYLDPADYLREALKRDPLDARCNQLMALISLSALDPESALRYCAKADKRLRLRNPNPYDTECDYIAGVAHMWRGEYDAAYESLAAAAWRHAERSQSCALMALIALRQNDTARAVEHAHEALLAGGGNQLAHWELALAARISGDDAAHARALSTLAELDDMDMLYLAELALSKSDFTAPGLQVCLSKPEYALDAALRYMQAGQYRDAIALLEWQRANAAAPFAPLTYALGWAYGRAGNAAEQQRVYLDASQQDTHGVLHSRPESLLILADAVDASVTDAAAPYYLGNMLYAAGQFERAAELFELSISRGAKFPTVYRNLAFACFDKRRDPASRKRAGELIARAFRMDRHDACVFYELCQYLRVTGAPIDERIALYEKHAELACARDDNYTNYIEAYVERGDYTRAEQLLHNRMFNSYEGGEGEILRVHAWTWALDGAQHLAAGDISSALERLERALEIDPNYQEGEGHLPRELSFVRYWKGLALRAQGDESGAQSALREGTMGAERASAVELIFRALCLRALDDHAGAQALLNQARSSCDAARRDIGKYHHFARSRVSYKPFEHDKAMMDELALAFPEALLAALDGDAQALERAAQRFPTEYRTAAALKYPKLFGID